MLTENKFSKYLIYAIGEIVLVVIGILIALSLNNLNEGRKREELRISQTNYLKRDLEADVVILNLALQEAENNSSINISFSERLSSPVASLDTLIKIARYEFNPKRGGVPGLNRTTYNSLIATGNIDLFGAELSDKVLDHYANLDRWFYNIKVNDQSYWNVIDKYLMSFPSKMKENAINGSLQDSFWQRVDRHKLQAEFNGVLMQKIFVSVSERSTIIELLKKTQELIAFIDSSSK